MLDTKDLPLKFGTRKTAFIRREYCTPAYRDLLGFHFYPIIGDLLDNYSFLLKHSEQKSTLVDGHMVYPPHCTPHTACNVDIFIQLDHPERLKWWTVSLNTRGSPCSREGEPRCYQMGLMYAPLFVYQSLKWLRIATVVFCARCDPPLIPRSRFTRNALAVSCVVIVIINLVILHYLRFGPLHSSCQCKVGGTFLEYLSFNLRCILHKTFWIDSTTAKNLQVGLGSCKRHNP